MTLPTLNPRLLQLAQIRVLDKHAFAPPAPPAQDPAAAGGGMPPPGGMPGAAPGGMPGAPPPGDPAAAAGGGMPPGAMTMQPGTPSSQPPNPAMQAPPKIKPEQMMQMLDFRMYNLQQQITAVMNHLGISIPPGALVLPPGSTAAPPAETAMPGGPMDPGPAGQQQAQQASGGAPGGAAPGGQASDISPVEPMPAAMPAAGGQKTAAAMFGAAVASVTGVLDDAPAHPHGWWDLPEAPKSASHVGVPVPASPGAAENQTSAAALAAMFRSQAMGAWAVPCA